MTTAVLVRHGETDWNVEGRWQGQADPPLNARGREQARQAAEALSKYEFGALYSSDLRRAWETAQFIAGRLDLCAVPEARLREINLGKWQGSLSADIKAEYPDAFARWHAAPLTVRPPEGEDLFALEARVLAAVDDIRMRHPDRRVALVSHELPIAIVRCHAAGLGLEHVRQLIPGNGQWVEVKLAGKWKCSLVVENDNSSKED
jgi:broad specificity phosphatase PhoE